MEKIYWDKLHGFKKFIFALGWIGVINWMFWVAMIIYYFAAHEKKFWSPGSYRVIYVFGWINFISLILLLFFVMIGIVWVVISNVVAVG